MRRLKTLRKAYSRERTERPPETGRPDDQLYREGARFLPHRQVEPQKRCEQGVDHHPDEEAPVEKSTGFPLEFREIDEL